MINIFAPMVWYSPEWDQWRIAGRIEGYVFKDDFGEFHSCWRTYMENNEIKFADAKFYLMGPF